MVVVMVVVVMVMGQWHGGIRRAWHCVHRVVSCVRLERVRLALGHCHIHRSQSFSTGQQGLSQAGEYVALQLQSGIGRERQK